MFPRLNKADSSESIKIPEIKIIFAIFDLIWGSTIMKI